MLDKIQSYFGFTTMPFGRAPPRRQPPHLHPRPDAGKNLVDEASARSAVTETSHDPHPTTTP